MTTAQPRQPGGTPAGGRFAPAGKPRPGIGLTEDLVVDDHAVEVALQLCLDRAQHQRRVAAEAGYHTQDAFYLRGIVVGAVAYAASFATTSNNGQRLAANHLNATLVNPHKPGWPTSKPEYAIGEARKAMRSIGLGSAASGVREDNAAKLLNEVVQIYQGDLWPGTLAGALIAGRADGYLDAAVRLLRPDLDPDSPEARRIWADLLITARAGVTDIQIFLGIVTGRAQAPSITVRLPTEERSER